MLAEFLAGKIRRGRVVGKDGSETSLAVPIAAVALSIAVMLLTIAIVSGFRNAIIGKLSGFNSQITVTAQSEADGTQGTIDNADEIAATVTRFAPGATVSPAVELPGLLKTSDNFSAIVFRGYDNSERWLFAIENIEQGNMPDYMTVNNSDNSADKNSIVISSVTAKELGAEVGDKIDVCYFVDGRIKLRRLDIAAVYNSNFAEFDKINAYASPALLRSVSGLDESESTSFEISGIGENDIEPVADAIKRDFIRRFNSLELPFLYSVSNIKETGALYFNWLDLLDTNVLVIIILMASICVFTIISSLFIIILERVAMIGTLKALGASNGLIRRTFILVASRIFVKGLLWGNMIGLALIFLQKLTRLVKLNPDAYYVSFVPVEINIWQFLILNISALAACYLVLILPSQIISRMRPSSVMKFE